MSHPVREPNAMLDYIWQDESGASIRTGPMTSRTAVELVPFYGHNNPQSFSDGLPENAEILDVGAGLSDLGHAVTYLRPDILWTNFDIRYQPGRLDGRTADQLRRLQDTKPLSLTYVAGSILQVPDASMVGRYDRIYSYFMIPHILAISRGMGKLAIRNMLTMLKPGAKLSFGPLGIYHDNAKTLTLDHERPNSRTISRLADKAISSYFAYN